MIIVLSAVLFPSAFMIALVALSGPRGSTLKPVEDGRVSQQLLAPDGALEDRLGQSVALEGDLALVGAPFAAHPLAASGVVHLFRETAQKKWNYLGMLYPHPAAAGDEFGWSIALSGSTALIGAPCDRQHGKNSGEAYLFEIDGDGTWQQIAELTPKDAAAHDDFGYSVALCGDLAIVGSPQDCKTSSGATYIFKKDGNGNWNEVAKLTPTDAGPFNGFGHIVAVEGQTAVVAAMRDRAWAIGDGAAYVFRCDRHGQWRQVAKLTTGDVIGGAFGNSLALHGDTLIVGACLDSSTKPYAGAAYIFRWDGQDSWRQVAKLAATDASRNDLFGYSVDIRGDTAIVGARRRHDAAGAVYAFRADGAGHWKQIGTYSAKDARENDWLGTSVALSDDTVVAGAHNTMGLPTIPDVLMSFV